MSPIERLNLWLTEEEQAGSPNPYHGILSTATQEAVPHARVVAIRQITEEGLLMFTQKATRKVTEMTENPKFSLVFWFPLHQREAVLEGEVEALTEAENRQYWDGLVRERQLRFCSYAPISSQPISSKAELAVRQTETELQYEGQPVQMSPYYCGFRLLPERVMFYATRTGELSEVIEYRRANAEWVEQLLSP